MGKTGNSTSTQVPKKKPNYGLYWAAVGFVIALLCAIWWYLRPPSVSGGTLERWVESQNFSPLHPSRSDYLPGTLLQISKGSNDRIAMASSTFVGDDTTLISIAKLGDQSISLDLEADGQLGGAKSADKPIEKAAGKLHAKMVLKGLEILSVPLDAVSDLVAKNQRVSAALTRNPDNLFIILQAMQASNVSFEFSDTVSDAAKLEFVSKSITPSGQGDFKLSESGSVVSTSPLVLGTQLAKLSEVSKALGGNDREVRLKEINVEELKSFRASQASESSRLYSGFDVYALAVGLGNYPNSSPRAGGQLPEAVQTADFVAKSLRRLVPPDRQADIHVYTSTQNSPGSFDTTRRATRDDILKQVDQFVADVRSRSKPNKQTLLVFYYFGHGLADGISKNVYLVPEAFVDSPDRHVSEMSGELIRVKEIIDRLSKASDKVLVLVDACRSHDSEDKQLETAWRDGLGQHADISGILGAIKDETGNFGPAAIVFGSKDGVAAKTVAVPDIGLHETGPLAATLEMFMDDTVEQNASYDLSQFLTRLQYLGHANNSSEDRAFTEMRADRQAAWGTTPIVSATPLGIAIRSTNFEEPFHDLFSQIGRPPPNGPTMRSGVGLEQLAYVEDDDGPKDMAVSPDGKDVYVLGWDYSINRATRGGARERINFGLDAAGFAWDSSLGLVLSQPDEGAFYSLHDAHWRRVVAGLRTEYLRQAGDGHVRAIAVNGSPPRIYKLGHGHLQVENSFRAEPDVLDLAVLSNGEVWLTEVTGLRRQDLVRPDAINDRLWRPTVLAASGRKLYVMSDDARFLYRRDELGRFSSLDLLDVGMTDTYIRAAFQRGLQVLPNNRLAILAGRWILRLDLNAANWTAL